VVDGIMLIGYRGGSTPEGITEDVGNPAKYINNNDVTAVGFSLPLFSEGWEAPLSFNPLEERPSTLRTPPGRILITSGGSLSNLQTALGFNIPHPW
jgi:hypothetical protein